MSQVEEYTSAIYSLIQKQRGIKVDEIAAELGLKRATVSKWLNGQGTEENVLALDRAITAISDRAGGPLAMTGAGPQAAEGFQEVMREGYLRANGWGLESLAGRIRRGTVE
jgi:transcriptional regulator with XRE-family HTH domain